jgi:hypothetical protein
MSPLGIANDRRRKVVRVETRLSTKPASFLPHDSSPAQQDMTK